MSLASPDYNPMPPNAQWGEATTPDGIKLRFAHWKTVAPPSKGTVLLLHGRAEYIEKLYETVGDLRKNGFDVLSFDWRGQGGSQRLITDKRRGFIDHFEQYVMDLETIMEQVALPDCRGPYFVLAHSTGSLVALMAAQRFTNRIRRMVLASPMLHLNSLPVSQTLIKWLAGAFHIAGLGKIYFGGGPTPDQDRTFLGNKLTTDPERFSRNLQFAKEFPETTIGGPTATWVFSACRAMDMVNDYDYHSQITIPTLIVCSGNDQVVDNEAAEHLGKRLRSGSTLIIAGGKHELLQERDKIREQLLAAFYAFIPGSDGEVHGQMANKAKIKSSS